MIVIIMVITWCWSMIMIFLLIMLRLLRSSNDVTYYLWLCSNNLITFLFTRLVPWKIVSCSSDRISCFSKPDFLFLKTGFLVARNAITFPNLAQAVITSRVPTPEANQENPVTFLCRRVKPHLWGGKKNIRRSNDEIRFFSISRSVSTSSLRDGLKTSVNYQLTKHML